MDPCPRTYFPSALDANTPAEALLLPKDKDPDRMRCPPDPPTCAWDVNCLTPVKSGPDSNPANKKPTSETTPMDFSSITTADLGITPKSFTKPSKGEIKSLAKKLRRQSTIGVRGSPENNSLIKFMAYQRRVKKQNIPTQPSPFKPRNALLKEKIMAFRSSLQPLGEKEKGIHLTDTLEDVNAAPRKQSKLGQVWPPKGEGDALKDNINNLSTNGDRTLANIQMSSMASISEKTLPVDSVAISEIVPVCPESSIASGPLRCTLIKEASETKSGTSTKTIDMEQGNQNLDSGASQTHLLEDIPSCRPNRVAFSPSGSMEEKLPRITPMKPPLSQPNFDDGSDNNGQGTLKAALKPECATHSDLKGKKSSSRDLHATCTRITRSSSKEKQRSDMSKRKIKNDPKCKSTEHEKDKVIAKSSCKKKPAPLSGKRCKKKKKPKTLYHQREIASKIPLLSPITEVAEEISFLSSCRSSSISQKSTFDHFSSSLLCAESTNGKPDEGNCLDHLNGQDGVTSQLEGDAARDIKKTFPLDPPENSSPEELKCGVHGNELVFKNDSKDPEVQKDPELLDLHGTFTVGSETDLLGMSNSVHLKRFPKRSRRLTCHGSDFEVFQSNDPGAAGHDTRALLPGENECDLLKDLERSIEASFSCVSRLVRRSMRQHRGSENEGLAWIPVPAKNVSSDCTTKRRRSFSCQATGLCHPKQVHGVNEEHENAPVAIGPRKSKPRRKSIFVLRSKNENLFESTVAI